MELKFNPKKKDKKVVLSCTIDAQLMKLVEEIMKKYNMTLSNSVNDILNYFSQCYETGEVEKLNSEDENS